MKIDPGMTLSELVDARPSLAREFERMELDYCCGGGRTLRDASLARGLDVDGLVTALEAASADAAPAEWSAMDAASLVDHLYDVHHVYLWDEMPRIDALVAKILDVHGTRHPELADIASCWSAIHADLEPHLVKEERVLFPMVKELAAASAQGASSPAFHCGTLRNPIGVMLREHDTVGDLLARMRQLTSGYRPPDDGCATYRAAFIALEQLEADTHLHIHMENNVLFPMVVRLEAELAAASR
ncbi:MAG: iron-sulfur cluster repair di-iron protein [Actinomycetota bacterium]